MDNKCGRRKSCMLGLFQKKSSGGGRQQFFVHRVGCLEAKCVRRVEGEINARCPRSALG